MRPSPMKPIVYSAIMAVTAALCVAWVASPAEAKGRKGALYANQHFPPNVIKDKKYAAAQIYVYTSDGTLVHSGVGKGQHNPGSLIELEPGEYLVEVGRSRTRHNLQRYTVAAGKVTIIQTGWVSIATWPRADQPKGDACRSWSAEVRVVREVNGVEYLVSSNGDLFPAEFSMVQLPVGTYRVYFNGLATDVTVKEDTVHSLALGTAGPYKGSKVRLAADKSEAAGVPSVGLCEGQPNHVLAGTWWRSHTVPIEEHPYEKKVWEQVTVEGSDGGTDRSIPGDKVRGFARHRGKGSDPARLSPKEVAGLEKYQDGSLSNSIGGKFQGTPLDTLFEDSTDVQ